MSRATSELNQINRELALYKGVWTLSLYERKALDHVFICVTNAGDFLHHLDCDSHEYKDFLQCCGYKYEVAYMNCGLSWLEELPKDTSLLISFRYRHNPNISIALVRRVKNEFELRGYKHLAPDYRSSMVPAINQPLPQSDL